MNVLFDHLWQSTLIAAALGILTLAYRENRSAVRYNLWFAASLKFLLPFSALTAIGKSLSPQFTPAQSVAPVFYRMANAAHSFSGIPSVAVTPAIPEQNVAALLLIVWACGFAGLSVLWLIRWSRLNAVVREARSVSTTLPFPVRVSTGLLEPGLVGIWRPVLLLPEGILQHLSPREMDVIAAHERCHLLRRDNLTGAIHMLITNLFWFHPLLWWLGARLVEERERACDEGVLAADSDPKVYAGSILRVCAFCTQSPLLCAAGVSGANLKRRIETIMANRPASRLTAAKKSLLAVIAASVVAVPVLYGMASSSNAAKAGTTPAAALVHERLAEQRRPRTEIAFNPAEFDRFVGYYRMDPATVFDVTRRGNRYFAGVIGDMPDEIYPESGNKFFIKGLSLPAQFSFLIDAAGHVTEMVLHQAGEEQHAPRITGAEGKAAEAALAQRVSSNTPSPGTAEALRHQIDGLMSGDPDYSRMAPTTAAGTRQMLAVLHAEIEAWGPVMSIRFIGVGKNGMDLYEVTCRKMHSKWEIAPLTPDGKISGILFGEETRGALLRRT
ncbi:MAG: M56 family metallopeptidase [Rhizomicrobium sp.]|jgi:beta-lactamase regulating signal transducer with metallopeptidase domain